MKIKLISPSATTTINFIYNQKGFVLFHFFHIFFKKTSQERVPQNRRFNTRLFLANFTPIDRLKSNHGKFSFSLPLAVGISLPQKHCSTNGIIMRQIFRSYMEYARIRERTCFALGNESHFVHRSN